MKRKATRRKPGRPKGSVKKVPKVKVKAGKKAVVKKQLEGRQKRGRPKGSKNRKTLEREAEEKLLTAEVDIPEEENEEEEEELVVSEVKTYKFLGYCPSCNYFISSADLEDARKVKSGWYRCPKCDRRGKVNRLCTESRKSDGESNRTLNKAVSGTVMNQHDKDIQDLLESKVQTQGFIDTDF